MKRGVRLPDVLDQIFSAVTTPVSRSAWSVMVSRTVPRARTRTTVPRRLQTRAHVTRSRVQVEDVPRGVMELMSVLTAVTRSIAAMMILTNSTVVMLNVLTSNKSVMGKKTAPMDLMNIQNVASIYFSLHENFVLFVESPCYIFTVGLCLAPNYRCADGRCIPSQNVVSFKSAIYIIHSPCIYIRICVTRKSVTRLHLFNLA